MLQLGTGQRCQQNIVAVRCSTQVRQNTSHELLSTSRLSNISDSMSHMDSIAKIISDCQYHYLLGKRVSLNMLLSATATAINC